MQSKSIDAEPTPHYCFITYNIRKGKGAHRSPPPFHELAHQLRLLQPDILVCQEVAQYHESSTAHEPLHQDLRFAKLLEMNHCYAPNAFFDHKNHGNASYSKHPITYHSNFNVSTNLFEHRGILLAETLLPFGRVYVFNVHFGLTPMQRRAQTRALETIIQHEVPHDAPVIIAGDFNDISGWVDRHFKKFTGFDAALSRLPRQDRLTWSSRNPILSLDRIYTKNINVLSVEVLKSPPWNTLSDHLPIRMIFSKT